MITREAHDLRREEMLIRDELLNQIAEVAWSKLSQQYQLPERKSNSIITRKAILTCPQPEKGEELAITHEYESLSNQTLLHRLVIRLVIESQAIDSPVVASTITFDLNEQGKSKGINAGLSSPQIFFEIKKLENLLKAVKDWSTKIVS